MNNSLDSVNPHRWTHLPPSLCLVFWKSFICWFFLRTNVYKYLLTGSLPIWTPWISKSHDLTAIQWAFQWGATVQFTRAVEGQGERKTNSQTRKEAREQGLGEQGWVGDRAGGSSPFHSHIEWLGLRKSPQIFGPGDLRVPFLCDTEGPCHFILSVSPSAKQLCRQRADSSTSRSLATGSPTISNGCRLAMYPCERSDWHESMSPRLYTASWTLS